MAKKTVFVKAHTREVTLSEGATVIKSANKKKIKEGFSNPKGMSFSSDKKTRAAVADEAHNILRKIQGKK